MNLKVFKLLLYVLVSPILIAQESDSKDELAKKLQNPIVSLISLPFQLNYDAGVSPTAVALKQSGSLTIGMLVNHIWSVAGEGDRSDVNSTFIQPFLAKNFTGG